MEKLNVNEEVMIHCYKHDGSIHRCWSKGIVLECNDDYCILINMHTIVTESDGRTWCTKEPAIWYLSFHDWFNVICMIRDDGVYYYCNIASPALYDGEAIKYIDYDLDLKVFPDGKNKILDEEEYKHHKEQMNYGDDLDWILHKELNRLIDLAKNGQGPFKKGFSEYWYRIYTNLRD